jgi:hypothetical protein
VFHEHCCNPRLVQKVVTPAGIVSGTIRTMEAHSDVLAVTKEGVNILTTLARSDTYRKYVIIEPECELGGGVSGQPGCLRSPGLLTLWCAPYACLCTPAACASAAAARSWSMAAWRWRVAACRRFQMTPRW